MSVLCLVLLLLVRMDRFIFDIQLLVTHKRNGFQYNGLLLSFNDGRFHVLGSLISVDLSSLSSLGTRVILIELLLELEVLFLEDVPDFSACKEVTLTILVLFQTAIDLSTIVMHEDVLQR